MTQRIGLFGGTFDPPHFGHLLMAECVRLHLQLDKVHFLPVGKPLHKTEQAISAVAHRLAMTELAIADNHHFLLDNTDINRPPPYTTATLLPLFQKKYPNSLFWLIIGSDSLCDFPQWYEPASILNYCRLAVVTRPNYVPVWGTLKKTLPTIQQFVDWVDAPAIGISSTDIRGRLQKGQMGQYLMPATVIRYIHQRNLYLP